MLRTGYVGVDLGGTKILTVVVDDRCAELGRARCETPSGPEAVLAAIERTVRDALSASGARRALAIGCGAPGTVDADRGVLLKPPNLPGCDNLPIGERLRAAFGVPVHLENDGNAAALAEWRLGAGRGCRDMLYVTLSTGIGGGIVAGGRLLRGAGGTAGEIGHMIVAPDGPACGCGNAGCWEQMASGTALGRLGGAPAPEVVRAARDGDPRAQAALGQVVRFAGIGFLNLLHVLEPERVVVGGGLGQEWDAVVAPAAEWALDHAFTRAARVCRFVPAELGEDVGALGAAVVAQGDGS